MGDKKFLDKITEKENRWKLYVAILLLVLLYIVFSFFTDTANKSNNNGAKEVSTMAKQPESDNSSSDNYERQQKTELTNILKKIDGIGNVEVMISFESDESKVLASDSTSQSSVTEETDTQGGKRVTNQKTDSSQVVMNSSGDSRSPLVVKTYKPKIIGVMVVAEGASDSKVKYDIAQAVSTLYGLSVNKVNVYPMKK